MLSFFFFGSLQDDDLRKVVLGRSTAKEDIAQAILRGYRCVRLRSRIQPSIVEDPEGQVEGTLARHLDVTAAARMSHYELGAYSIASKVVDLPEGGQETAWIFLSDPDLSVAPGDWRLETWQLRYKRRSLAVARAWMSQLGHSKLVSLETEWRQRCSTASGG